MKTFWLLFLLVIFAVILFAVYYFMLLLIALQFPVLESGFGWLIEVLGVVVARMLFFLLPVAMSLVTVWFWLREAIENGLAFKN